VEVEGREKGKGGRGKGELESKFYQYEGQCFSGITEK
jgi:hypothetical protein